MDKMTNKKINIGDWVKVLIYGIDGLYVVESIEDDVYTITQEYKGMSTRGHYSKGSYSHKMELPLKKISKV
jgi:hypothetical protein